jgi:hypothetical protein
MNSSFDYFGAGLGILQIISKVYECGATRSPPPIYSGLIIIIIALMRIRAYASG